MVIPASVMATVTELAHKTHPGVVRTKHRPRKWYWCQGLDRLSETAASTCVQMSIPNLVTAPLEPIPLPEQAWQKLAIDIVGPFTTGNGHK